MWVGEDVTLTGGGIRNVLTLAGRNGPWILLVGVLVGLVSPALADAARPWLGLAVFIFTLGAFLKVDLASFRKELERPAWSGCMLAWTTFGAPLVMLGLVHLAQPEAGLAQGMILSMLAPPVGSGAAIAAMLGLSAPLSLLATITATILSPFYLPPLVSLFAGYQLHIDPVTMTERLLLIVGGACGCAMLLRRYARRFVVHNPHAMSGIAVFGLILMAIGAMRGVRNCFVSDPQQAAIYVAVAFTVNIMFQALGATLFAYAGPIRALTVGLVSGNRSVTLVWAAASATLMGQKQTELYLAATLLPVFMLPALTKPLVTRLLRPSGPKLIGPEAAS